MDNGADGTRVSLGDGTVRSIYSGLAIVSLLVDVIDADGVGSTDSVSSKKMLDEVGVSEEAAR